MRFDTVDVLFHLLDLFILLEISNKKRNTSFLQIPQNGSGRIRTDKILFIGSLVHSDQFVLILGRDSFPESKKKYWSVAFIEFYIYWNLGKANSRPAVLTIFFSGLSNTFQSFTFLQFIVSIFLYWLCALIQERSRIYSSTSLLLSGSNSLL